MKSYLYKIILLLFFPVLLTAQEEETYSFLEDTLTNFGKKYALVGKVKIRDLSINPANKKLILKTGARLSYLPLRPQNVDSIYLIVKDYFNYEYPNYEIVITSDDKEISSLISGIYRRTGKSQYKRFSVKEEKHPLVTNISLPYQYTKGLQKRHVALWQSHGKYYNQKQQKWIWQRPVIFSSVEDLYTQTYVLPFLVPMLENAGANVLLPRERDTQTEEIIIDWDSSSYKSSFSTYNSTYHWKMGKLNGFGNRNAVYKEKENPFQMGHYYQVKTTTDSKHQSIAKWIPYFNKKGKYAVYVSYKTLPNSAKDVHYRVYHLGGKTDFKVNQTMGGGTWIYLGHFDFPKGKHKKIRVEVSNLSHQKGKLVTADAIKIGGGMGNITRKPADRVIKKRIRLRRRRGRRRRYKIVKKTLHFENYTKSNAPRFTEGARYWLQWAGVPDSVYSRTEGKNDYSDDFQSRGFWVNYLAGGSSVLPYENGLNIPIDMALAFHSDAGLNKNDSIIGTLAIFTVKNTEKKTFYKKGFSRWNAREYTDIVQSQIVNDIRKTYKQDWNRRGLWNRNYSESRVPEVPTMLLEMLSHQNFADMQFGLDPRFRFTVSRAIYKGILRYISVANNQKYVVQPLPVHSFSTTFNKEKNKVLLKWQPTKDPLEPTAKPRGYIVYTRKENEGFNNGVFVRNNRLTVKIKPNTIYSFKVEAVNEGGKSFPSEILSVCNVPNNKPTVLVVNGFTKISAPKSFSEEYRAGFDEKYDAGVPYISDIGYTGEQFNFDRNAPYKNYDDVGFGGSQQNYTDKVIAGNSFDYPYIHGKAIKKANYSFVSVSKKSVLENEISLKKYNVVDFILGKQSRRVNLLDSTKMDFITFEPKLINEIEYYTQNGGNLIISGSNIVSDCVLSEINNVEEKSFIENILKLKWHSNKLFDIQDVYFSTQKIKDDFSFYNYRNEKCYFVETPDILEPNDNNVNRIAFYKKNNLTAGVSYKKNYGFVLFGFPIETIKSEKAQYEVIKSSLDFLTKENRSK